MKLPHLTVLAAVIFAGGCDHKPQTPGAVKQNYPSIISDSTDRRAKAEREWRRMLDAYKVPPTPPDLYPITYTPRSLLGVTGGFKLLAAPAAAGEEKLALREAVKGFLERWREFLAADPAAVSLVSADETGDVRRFTYRQSNYSYPIAGGYGEIVAVLSKDGRLMQLDDRFIPQVELPLRAQIERGAAAQRMVGRTFKYSDISGTEQTTQVTRLDDVTVRQLVVIPIEKGDAIEVHLAWEVLAGSSLSWTIYVDAINGEELRVVQNFNT
jgi:hypothetical protein